MTVQNPFATQPVILEIRPRPDYFPLADARHLLITSFSDDGAFTVQPGHAGVTCTLHNGLVTIINPTTGYSGCTLTLSGNLNLSFKRGVGLSITASGGNELVTVRLNRAFGARDFQALMDFTGQRDLVLDHGTGSVGDKVNGVNVNTFYAGQKERHWDYDYSYHPKSSHIDCQH
jgi:hypothetical protein